MVERARRVAALLVAISAVALAWAGTSAGEGEFLHAYSFRAFLGSVLLSYAAIALSWSLLGPGEARVRRIQSAILTVLLGAGFFVMELPAVLFTHDYGRTFGTSRDVTWLQLADRVNRRDPELIHLHQPDSRYQNEVVGNLVHLGIPNPTRYRVDVRYDANGFRNDPTPERAEVVAIGDSFVEAALLPVDDTVTAQLEQRLGVKVANFGQSAYGFRQELVVLDLYASRCRPKLVLLFLFSGNDLRDVRYYEELRANFERLDDPPPLAHRLFTRHALKAVANLAEQLLRTEPAVPARVRSARYLRSDGSEETVYFGEGESPWTDHQWEVMTTTLLEARRISQNAGAEFMVVLISRKFRVYRDHLREPIGEEVRSWRLNQLPEALGRWCEQHGIPFLDTTPALAGEVAAGRHTYFVDDVHWNAHGHRIAADLIADHLRSIGWTAK